MNTIYAKTLAIALVLLTMGNTKASAEEEVAKISTTGYSTLYYKLDKSSHAAVVVNANEYATELKVPNTVTDANGVKYNVTAIDYEAFKDNSTLTSIDLSACEKLAKIDCSAFENCKELQSVIFPTFIQTIERYAFAYCPKLEKVTFSRLYGVGQLTIKTRSFKGCGLTSLKLDDEVVNYNDIYIEDYAFNKCENLRTVSVTGHVDDYAFSDCTYLKEITFDTKTNYIGWDVIANCNYISTINYNTPNACGTEYSFSKFTPLSEATVVINNLPQSWDGGDSPFKNGKFKNVVLNCPFVPANTFKNCINLETIMVTTKVKAYGMSENLYEGCPKMYFLTNNSNFKTEDGNLYNADKTVLYVAAGKKRSVEIPSTVTTIEANALDPYNNPILDARALKTAATIRCSMPDFIYCTPEAKPGFMKQVKDAPTEFLLGYSGKRGDLNDDNVVDGVDITTLVNIVNGGE